MCLTDFDRRQNYFIFATFLLISLGVRLLLLNWYSAPYTDGVFLLTLFEKYNFNNSYPPLYSALLYLVNYFWPDPILSGRLISALSGVGLIAGLFYCGRRFFSPQVGLVAALFYGTAPEVWRWDLRVMSDSLFALLFCGALYFLFCQLNGVGRRNFLWFNLCAALSALTRYQGLVFLPLTLGWYFLLSKRDATDSRLTIPLGFVAWLPLPAWIVYRGFEHAEHYRQFLTESGSVWLTLGKFLMMFDLFVPALFYSYGYLALPFVFYGLYVYQKKQVGQQRWFIWLVAYLFGAFWVAHAAFLVAFQTRYFLPFWPLVSIFAALGLFRLAEKRAKTAWVILGAILLSNVFWSGMVLYYQRDSFASLKRSAQYVAQNLPNATIITCEDYKFTYFAGRFRKGETFQKRYRIYSYPERNPQPGDYVYVNSIYTPDFMALYEREKENVVYRDQERVLPILPDVGNPSNVNTTQWLATRFLPQEVYSAILRVP